MNPVSKSRVKPHYVAPPTAPALDAEYLLRLTVVPHPRFGLERPERARRILNVAVAVLALIVCAPLLITVAVLIAITAPGPILYTQTRVGLDRRRTRSSDGRRRVNYGGRLFRIYKFRTMRIGADRHGEVWASPDDPRVTPLGRILRKYRIDELPQLINVLKGEMNVVGPRPEQPRIFARMRDEIEYYAERQRVLPGITGLAQVKHHYGSSVEDVRQKLIHDLHYIARRSWREDLKVLLLTVPVVVYKRGAW